MNKAAKPTDGQLEALRRIKKMEKGLETIFVKRADASECEDHGWAVKRPGNRSQLTDEGRTILRNLDQP